MCSCAAADKFDTLQSGVNKMMMRNLIFSVLGLFLLTASNAEVIESVSFNPSRFGQYERLTVSESADLKGGLSATNLNVSSAGSVDVTVNKPLSDTTAFFVPEVDAVQGNGVRLTNACFSGSGADCKNYDASSATLPNTSSEPLVVSSLSGEGSFERDSFINKVTTVADRLRVKAGQISLATLKVYGGGGNPYSGPGLTGLKLAGNDIPAPESGYTTGKTGAGAGRLTGCTLAWDSRNTVQKDGKYDTYKVLALKDCGGASGGGSTTPKGKWVRTGMEEQVCGCTPQCKPNNSGPSPIRNATAGGECSPVGSVVYSATSDKRCYCIKGGMNMPSCVISYPEVRFDKYTCQ